MKVCIRSGLKIETELWIKNRLEFDGDWDLSKGYM